MVGAGVDLPREGLEEVEALLRLKEIGRLGDRGIRVLMVRHGSGASALKALGAQGDLLQESVGREAIEGWVARGMKILPISSQDYPRALLELSDPPPLLFLRGNGDLLRRPGVAVVGSRRATEGGRRVAEALARVLAGAGVTVISGMALGIDGAAHRGALQAGGNTLAVLGSGLDVVYPLAHRGLSREIARRGLLVSEFLPSEQALSHHFPKRNRILAALARAVVVVEAAEKSGALITVDHALDLGREVLAVPGSVENPQARGSNALLREGARLLPYPEAILEELEDLVEEASRDGCGGRDGEAEVRPAGGAPVPRELEPLWNVLGSDPVGLDELAGSARLPTAEALAGLAALELGGWVIACPGMRFRRA